ncbi:hypothetical protein EDD36DRAFT_318670 [Exophiala viscosa]|uniref:Uncharacterized protein n=1 Tax=Exophiala viscosa TaxID=2486360 RepID=A0AAN6DSX8_9EURO|nr:hypothetical protein EDD36DRAFT_318670 [Exophiala viscosa]
MTMPTSAQKTPLLRLKGLIDSCKRIFQELDTSLDGKGSNNSIVIGWKRRAKFPFIEAHVELLRSNLERLKSSLLLMLQVLTFAVQAKSHRELGSLRDQKALVQTLMKEKNDSEKRYKLARKSIESSTETTPAHEAEQEALPSSSAASKDRNSVTVANPFISTVFGSETAGSPKVPGEPSFGAISTPPTLRYRNFEIQQHGAAVRTLLAEVDRFEIRTYPWLPRQAAPWDIGCALGAMGSITQPIW